MRKYEKPQFNVEKLEVSDIITASIFDVVDSPDKTDIISFTELISKENW